MIELVVYIPVSEYGHIDQYCRNPSSQDAYVVLPYVSGGGEYTKATIENGRPLEEKSIVSVITHYAEASGKTALWRRVPKVFESLVGNSDALEITLS